MQGNATQNSLEEAGPVKVVGIGISVIIVKGKRTTFLHP